MLQLSSRRKSVGATAIEYAVLLGMASASIGAGAYIVGNSVIDYLNNGQIVDDSDGGDDSGGGDGSTGPPAGTVFYENDFDSPNARARWHFQGPWDMSDGVMTAGPANRPQDMRAYLVNSDFGDGTISLDAAVQDGPGFGVFFHTSGDVTKKNQSISGYSFEFDRDSGTFSLRKFVNGVELAEPISSHTVPSFQGSSAPHHFELTSEGNQFSARVDGQTVLTHVDASPTARTAGGFGLRLPAGGSTVFDNLIIATP